MGAGASSSIYSKDEIHHYRLLRKAMNGDTSVMTMKHVQEIIPKDKLKVFVSSTFTDTHRERNVLSEVILPCLQKKARSYGVSVIFVDFRYGVTDESTNDHMTWVTCSSHIRNCYEQSGGLFFLSLQSNKYGYRSLPKQILHESMITHQSSMKCSPLPDTSMKELKDAEELLEQWYHLNTYVVPHKYTLKCLSTDATDQTAFYKHLPVLRKYLTGLEFEPQMLIGKSITENETKLAFSFDINRCFWFHRDFQGTSAQTSVRYADFHQDPEVGKHYHDLIAYMKQSKVNFVETSTATYCPLTVPSYLNRDDQFDIYIKAFEVKARALFEKELTDLIQKYERWNTDHYQLGLFGQDLLEILHHLQMASRQASGYIERRHLLEEALHVLHMNEYHTSQHAHDAHHHGHHHRHRRHHTEHEQISQSVKETPKVVLRGIESSAEFASLQMNPSLPMTAVSSNINHIMHHSRSMPHTFHVSSTTASANSSLSKNPTANTVHEMTLADVRKQRRQTRKNSIESGEKIRQVIAKALQNAKEREKESEHGAIEGDDNSDCDEVDIASLQTVDEDEAVNNNHPLRVSLCVVGLSGSGKTGFMSKLVQRLHEQFPTIPAIVRFCGTTVNSMTITQLLRSVCLQIHFVIHGKVQSEVPTKYSELIKCFHDLLTQHPVILLLDSLDQLSNQYQARSRLGFLRCSHPFHQFTRIILSTLPDERNPLNPTEWLYCYQCDTRLQEAHVPRVHMPLFREDALNEAEIILLKVLTHHHLHLPKEMIDYILEQLKQEPTILYIQLAVNVIQTHFFHHPNTNPTIVPTAKGLIHQILNDLEHTYGHKLVRYAVAFLTFSVSGISDYEMHYLLSLHDEVLKEVFLHTRPENVRNVPMHVWLGLRDLMKDLLVEHTFHCYVWYHRQFKETAVERFPNHEELQHVHRLMGMYFGNIVSDAIRKERMIEMQPLVLNQLPVWHSKAVINERRCAESVFHFIGAKMWKEAVKEMCTLEYVYACIVSGYGFDVVNNLFIVTEELKFLAMKGIENQTGVTKSNKESARDQETQQLELLTKRADHYLRWLQRDISKITTIQSTTHHRTPIVKDEHVNYIRNKICMTAANQPKCSMVRQDYYQLLSNTETKCIPSLSSWFRIKAMGGHSQFSTLLAILHGHKEIVSAVQYNADGSKFVSSSYDKTLRLWDSISGKCLQSFEGHTDEVNSVVFNCDGSKIISGSSDNVIKVWDIVSGNCIHTLHAHKKKVSSVAKNAVNSKIVSGSWDHSVILWDSNTGELLRHWKEHVQDVTCVAYSDDGMTIASGSDDGTIKIWDEAKAYAKYTLQFHTRRVNAIALSKDGSKLISGSDDKIAQVWNVFTGERLICMDEHISAVTAVAFSADHGKYASGSRDGEIMIWNDLHGKIYQVLDHHTQCITGLSLNHYHNRLISSSADCTIMHWDIVNTTDESIDNSKHLYQGHNGPVITVLFCDHGQGILSASSDKSIRYWNIGDGEGHKFLPDHKDVITAMDIHPEGLYIATGCADGIVRIWQYTRKLCAFSIIEGNPIDDLCYSHDGRRILTVALNKIKIWDALRDNALQWTIPTVGGSISFASFHPTGNKLVYCSDDVVYIVGMNKASVTSDDNILHELLGHEDRVIAAKFHPDGTFLVSASADHSLRIWDTETGALMHVLEGHTGKVNCVSYYKDGSRIVSGSDDKTVRIWESKTGKCIAVFEEHTANVRSVAFSPDGNKIVSGGDDRKVFVWDAVEVDDMLNCERN